MSIAVKPIRSVSSLKDQVYRSLRNAVANMDIYSGEEPPRLDERKLADSLGVSRTPVREAISRLEQAGLHFSGRHPKQPIMQVLELPYWEWEEIRRCDIGDQRAFWEKKLGEGAQRWW